MTVVELVTRKRSSETARVPPARGSQGMQTTTVPAQIRHTKCRIYKRRGAASAIAAPRDRQSRIGLGKDLHSVMILNPEQTEDAIEVFLVSEFDAQFALPFANRDIHLRVQTITQPFSNGQEFR